MHCQQKRNGRRWHIFYFTFSGFGIKRVYLDYDGPGRAVGTATAYGLDGPGIESWWGRGFSVPVQTGPGAHPASCTMGTVFPGGKVRPGSDADPSPPSNAEIKNRVELYLYSP